MSASTSTTDKSKSNSTAKEKATSAPLPMTTGTGATLPAITVEIAGLQVNLPVKFKPGHVLTDNEAKTLDAAYQRQFTNNQNSIAKGRADKLAKATTDADKAALVPLTAAQIAALYTDYAPQVGGGPRMGSLERMRHDAGWKAWVKVVAEHNKSVGAGGAPVIAKAGQNVVTVGPQKGNLTADAYKTARKDWDETGKDAFTARILTTPWMADRVQAELDAMIAAKEAEKSAAPAANVASVTADSLF